MKNKIAVDVNDAGRLAQAGLFAERDILTGKIKIQRVGGCLGDIRTETYAEQD